MCVVAHGGRFLLVNDALCHILGRDRDELLAMTWQEVTHPDDVQTDLDLVEQVVAGGTDGFRLLKRFIRKDGEIVWGDLTTAATYDSNRHPTLWVSQVVDVTARIAAEEKFRLLAENVSDVVLHLDRGRVIWVSPSLRTALGWQPADWIGHMAGEFHHPDDRAMVAGFQDRLRTGEEIVARVRVLAADGTYHWVSGHSVAYRAPTAGPDESVVSLRLVDEDVAWEAELDRRANYDELTNLLTRRALFESFALLQQRYASGSPSSLCALFCDLDDFKLINDTYGHAFGDRVLRTLAERILSVTRQGDLVARMGGDEVLVVLHDSADLTEAQRIAERIRTTMAAPIPAAGGEVRISASIGVAKVRAGETADALIARADAAMYQAKRARRGTVVSLE